MDSPIRNKTQGIKVSSMATAYSTKITLFLGKATVSIGTLIKIKSFPLRLMASWRERLLSQEDSECVEHTGKE